MNESSFEIEIVQPGRPATLEYVGSILNSYIGLDVVEAGKALQIRFSFPYPAEGAFHNCFEAIRRCMAVLPLRQI
jgi:hypothetical protein